METKLHVVAKTYFVALKRTRTKLQQEFDDICEKKLCKFVRRNILAQTNFVIRKRALSTLKQHFRTQNRTKS